MEWINIAFFTSLFNIHYVNKYVGYSIIQALFYFTNINMIRNVIPFTNLKINK